MQRRAPAAPGAKRSISAAQLASSEAGATSRLRPGLRLPRLPLQHQQQREHLDRLAEPHVVGQAGAEPEAARAGAASARRPAGRAAACPAAPAPGSTCASPCGLRSPLQRLGQPGPGDDLRPVGVGGRRLVLARRRARRRAGASPRRTPGRSRAAVRSSCLEAVEHALQLLAVDLDPAAAHQRQPVRSGQQLADLGGGQRLAIERDVHAEIEQRRPGRAPTAASPPTVPVTRGRGGRLPRHAAGMRTTTPARFELRDVAQQLQASLGRPAQRMEDLARDRPSPSARRRSRRRAAPEAAARAAGLLAAPRILAQRLAERQMLRLAPAPRAAWYRSPGRRTARRGRCGSRRG